LERHVPKVGGEGHNGRVPGAREVELHSVNKHGRGIDSSKYNEAEKIKIKRCKMHKRRSGKPTVAN